MKENRQILKVLVSVSCNVVVGGNAASERIRAAFLSLVVSKKEKVGDKMLGKSTAYFSCHLYSFLRIVTEHLLLLFVRALPLPRESLCLWAAAGALTNTHTHA